MTLGAFTAAAQITLGIKLELVMQSPANAFKRSWIASRAPASLQHPIAKDGINPLLL
jgi:hypothetical protein